MRRWMLQESQGVVHGDVYGDYDIIRYAARCAGMGVPKLSFVGGSQTGLAKIVPLRYGDTCFDGANRSTRQPVLEAELEGCETESGRRI